MGRVDRIKRLSYEVLDQHKSKFGENFTDNKKLLDELTIIRSKGLKNEIAGYITKFIKSENRDQEIRNAQREALIEEKLEEIPLDATEESQDTPGETAEQTPETEETVIEIGVDEPETPATDEPSEEKTE
jgi:small subunit ribosomal protein S17e